MIHLFISIGYLYFYLYNKEIIQINFIQTFINCNMLLIF